jgi:hypothetical protein
VTSPTNDEHPPIDWNVRAEPLGPPAASVPPPRPAYALPRRKRRTGLVVLLLVCAFIVGAGGVVVAYGLMGNKGPFRDSGITACESMRDRTSAQPSPAPSGKAGSTGSTMTEAQYRATRRQFADSRYGDIRDAGTRFVDLVWQLSRMGGDTAALVLVGPLYQAWASLVGACENHGVSLPAMGASGAP